MNGSEASSFMGAVFGIVPETMTAFAVFLIGAAFGAVVQRSHFCTMGSISDAVLFGSLRRLRIWALAIAMALLGSQALDGAGLVALAGTSYRQPVLFWLGAVLGGLVFGFGMVLAGGCPSRNLVRLGTGSLKALTALLVTGIATYATILGVLAPLHASLRAVGTLPLGEDQGLPAILAAATGLPATAWTVALTLLVASALLAFSLRDPAFRRAPGEIATGLALGALVPAGWLATGWLGADPMTPAHPQSLTYVGPVGNSLLWLMTGGSDRPGFAVALVAGTLLGAFAVGLWCRQIRLETFVARDDMVRHLAGGALMGCGGALAQGCTIGQGLTGVATLSLGSWLTLAAILAGGWWGVKHLETGRLLPFLPAPVRAAAPLADTGARHVR
ncbi:YeeE/YedE family protein [Benzoatithermus flavus]|uniref:YeeE/YedE family protein n=1 Tax=Benzoatithermus flavus TaxID=3108223 RepID=A0ABU8XV56_9PROT